MSSQALPATPKDVGHSVLRPLQRAQHLSSLWTPGKISATPLGQTSRSSCHRASQVSTSSACGFPWSADSTHDPNRTGRSEVMVRVSPSREDSVCEGRNFKGKFEIISSTFFLQCSLRRATSRDAWRFQSWTGLQQRHTICIGARRDNYNSSLQGVDRFTHIVEDDAEHGYQQHSASSCS